MERPEFCFSGFKRRFHITKIHLILGALYCLYFYFGAVIGMISYNWVFTLLVMDVILAQALYIYYKELKEWREQ